MNKSCSPSGPMTFQFNIFCTFLLILSTIIIRDSYLFIILMSSTALYSLWMFLVFFWGFFGNIYWTKCFCNFSIRYFIFLLFSFSAYVSVKSTFIFLKVLFWWYWLTLWLYLLIFTFSALILWKISSFTSFATFCFNLQYHDVSYLSSFLLRTY